jgi:hypothetical protein
MGYVEKLDVPAAHGASTADCIGYVEPHDAFAASGHLATSATLSGAGRNDSSAFVGRDTAFATLGGTGRADSLAAAASWGILGSLGTTGRNDVFAGATPPNSATIGATERHDTASISAFCIVATMGGTGRADALSGTGGFKASSSIAATTGSDALAGSGVDRIVGSIGATGGTDNAALAASSATTATAHLLAGADVLGAAGFQVPIGGLAATARNDSFAGGSGTASSASMGATESHDAMAASTGNLEYHVYANTGVGDAINYNSPVATTASLTFTTAPLTFPGIWRWGVRAFDPVTMLEEENLDAAVTIILDAAGVDITNRPKAPSQLRAIPRAAGTIRVEWAYNTINPSPIPTGFHVYVGIGPLSYTSPIVVDFNASIAGTFFVDVPGLTDGTTYTIGVRAFNGVAEEPNTVTVNCTADSTGPSAVISLTATAV